MPTTYQQQAKLKLTATIVTIIVVAAIVLLADHLKSAKHLSTVSLSTPPSASHTTTSQPSPSMPTGGSTSSQPGNSSAPAANSSGYKNGTYTASSDYYVPHGYESIAVSLTVNNGTVSDVSIQNSENNGTSAFFQENFSGVYKSQVVGRKLSGLQISDVSGASDTTRAFNTALNQIENQVQAS